MYNEDNNLNLIFKTVTYLFQIHFYTLPNWFYKL